MALAGSTLDKIHAIVELVVAATRNTSFARTNHAFSKLQTVMNTFCNVAFAPDYISVKIQLLVYPCSQYILLSLPRIKATNLGGCMSKSEGKRAWVAYQDTIGSFNLHKMRWRRFQPCPGVGLETPRRCA